MKDRNHIIFKWATVVGLLFVFSITSEAAWWNTDYTHRRNCTNGTAEVILPVNSTNNVNLNGTIAWLYSFTETGNSLYYNNSNDSRMANDTTERYLIQTSPLNRTSGTAPASLLRYYPLDNGLSSALDFSGYGGDGELSAGNFTQNISGAIHNAYKFNASVGYFNSTLALHDLSSAGVYTTSLWLRTNQTTRFDFGAVNGLVTEFITWSFNMNQTGSSVGHLLVRARNGGVNTNYINTTATFNFSDDNWHNFVFVHNLSGVDGGNSRIYIDGVSVSIVVYQPNDASGMSDNDSIFFGARANDGAADYNFTGLLDDIRIYNRLLSLAEVAALYDMNATLGAQETYSAPAIDSVAITSPPQYSLWQRNSTNGSRIPVYGLYNGTPTTIEARINGSAWQVIDGAPAGNVFSGNLTAQITQGDLDVRFSNNHSINDTVNDISVGDIYVIMGQSNARGRGDINQTLSGSNPVNATHYRCTDDWVLANDAIGTCDGGDKWGSGWPRFADQITQNTGIPIAFINTAIGGSIVAEWKKVGGLGYYGDTHDQINEATNGTLNFKAILWFQGESDTAGVRCDYGDYTTDLSGIINDSHGDWNFDWFYIGQIAEYTNARPCIDIIRWAQQDLWSQFPATTRRGAITYDINLSVDGAHFRTNAELTEFGDRWFGAVRSESYVPEFDGIPPVLSIAAASSNQRIVLTFNESSTPLIPTTVNKYFIVRSAGATLNFTNISTATVISNTEVELNFTATLTFPLNISMCSYRDCIGQPTINDSSTLELPAQLIFEEIIAAPTNSPPVISGIAPTDGSLNMSLNITLNYTVTDADGNTSNCMVINDSDNTALCTNNTVATGTTIHCNIFNLPYSYKMNWSINCTDTVNMTTAAGLDFTTLGAPAPPPVPSNLTVPLVIVTPLYANVFSTLTCRYFTAYAGAITPIPEYEWYDGDDGVWYTDQTATYTSIENGFDYRCRVRVNNTFNVSAWTTSLNNVTVSASCINPLPFWQAYDNGTNITLLDGFDYRVYTNFSYNYIDNIMQIKNQSFLFLGGGYNETSDTFIPLWTMRNLMRGQTTTGNFNSDGNDTDENHSTYYAFSFLVNPGVDSWRNGTYNLTSNPEPNNLLAGSTLFYNISMRASAADVTWTRFYLDVQNASNGAWINVAYHTQVSATFVSYGGYADIVDEANNTRIRLRGKSGGAARTHYFRIYEIRQNNYTQGGGFGNQALVENLSISNMQRGEGSLYQFQYLDEETRNPFNFSTGGALNETSLRIYCPSTVSVIDTSSDVLGRNYTLGMKGIPRRIETLIEYDDGSDYFRRITYTSCDNRYQAFDYYVVDATVNSLMFLLFTINDETPAQTWANGMIRLNRFVDTVLDDITGDMWQADNTAGFFLIPNREYSITLIASDCSENNVGWITTEAGTTTKTITVQGLVFDTTHMITIFDTVSFSIFNTSTQICFQYNDSQGVTDWVYWAVLNRSTMTVLFSDNTTSQNYLSCYIIPSHDTDYSVQVIFSHPNGSIYSITQGTVYFINRVFSQIEDVGSIFIGLETNTFWLLASLLAISFVAMGLGAKSTGAGAFILFGMTVFFSVVGWLPIQGDAGMILMVTLLLVAMFESYRQSRT